MSRRRIFVGDIQGCRDALERLLAELAFDPARDELHPVGDMVNRGPDNVGTLRLLRSLGAGGVVGNHDLHLLRLALGEDRLQPRDTVGDVLAAPDRDELVAWLAARPFVRAWPDVLLVHAGLPPTWLDPVTRLTALDPRVRHPDGELATRVRWCDAEGRRPSTDEPPPGAPFRPWFEHPRAATVPSTVVFGHWSARGLVHAPGLRGLDTGCVWGRTLTAWIAEEDRLVEVPAVLPPAGARRAASRS